MNEIQMSRESEMGTDLIISRGLCFTGQQGVAPLELFPGIWKVYWVNARENDMRLDP